MQAENPFTKKLQALNGNMGPPISNLQGTPAVPKMGIRARVSDWPQRQDGGHGPPPRFDSLMTNFQSRIPSQSTDEVINQNQEALNKPSFIETKYGLLSHSPGKDFRPMQKRSNSDITLSDIGAEDVDQTAVNPNTGTSLHREYGSTSSIDRQGITGEGLFTTPRSYPAEHSKQPSAPPPHGFPEYLQHETISPSLQTAAQIARGDIICIQNYSDYVDSSLFYSRNRERTFLQRQKSDRGETSIFRRLKTVKSEAKHLIEQDSCSRHGCTLGFQRCFAHYDVQSVLFNISEAVTNRSNLARRKNITTGASAASQHHAAVAEPLPACGGSPLGSFEDLGQKSCTDPDKGDGKSSGMVLSCPYFRNEVGGEGERKLGLAKTGSAPYSSGGENHSVESALTSHCTNAGVSVLESPCDSYSPHENYAVPRDCIKRYIIEHIDMGAYYYHKFFYNKEHQNYFGVDDNLGPVALSVRRERQEESKDGVQYNYRVIFRTSELTTLRGSILEDAVPSTAKHGTARGLPLKEVLEYVVPELNIQCLRLAVGSPKVSEQLLKLDQQGLSYQHKVGIMYCQAGQSTEEEMYNNKSGSPAFEEFLDLLGQRVLLKGFTKYRAELDNKTDSTGSHSLYTVYKDHEIMFHVSTMLPYTPNNKQQLLKKRHIGNDIVTIIFQEPGALPFTPKNICSHFQHIFIIVKVHNPCTEHVSYSVAVARSKDVPVFGPPIPKGAMFPKSVVFRDFLLAKMINGENAAHKSEKFRAMATRTRQEYLNDLAKNFASATPVDSSAAKFSFISLGTKRKERSRPRVNAHLHSSGAITWPVVAQDFSISMDIGCLLAISSEFVVLIEEASKEVVFNCYCRDVIGWSSSPAVGRVKLFYEHGDFIVFSVQDGCAEEVFEVTQRLEMVTGGCETIEMSLRRNALGQLGFHVNFEGVVADVEPFGFAWQAGLRPGSRLVEICNVAVSTLSHEQMIDLLRTSTSVSVLVVQPHKDGTPRRACSELCRFPVLEYKTVGAGAGWNCMSHPPQGLTLSRMSPTLGPDRPSPGQQMFQYAQAAISRSTSFDKKYQDCTWILQDFDLIQSPTGIPGHPYCSSPSNQSTSSDPGPCGTWNQKPAYDGRQSPAFQEQTEGKEAETCREQEHRLERTRSAEAKWHIPSTKILNKPVQRQEGKDSSRKFPQTQEKSCHSHCSSHSSSNTLSSNTSGSSDDKRFGSGDPMDPESLGLTYIKGASTDSGIDTTSCIPTAAPPLTFPEGDPVGMVQRTAREQMGLPWAVEYPEEEEEEEEEEEREEDTEKALYMQNYVAATAGGHATDGSTGDLSEISSLSSGSRHSGSPSEHNRVSKSRNSMDSKVYAVSPTSSSQSAGLDKYAFGCAAQSKKYLTNWKKEEDGCSLTVPEQHRDCRRFYTTDSSRLVGRDMKLRTLSEEGFKMQLPDNTTDQLGQEKVSSATQSPHRSLYRTLSDESLCSSNRRVLSLDSLRSFILEQALPNDILFSSVLPYHSTLPPRLSRDHTARQLKNEMCFSENSLAEKNKLAETDFMPLPATSGLDWSHLVDAAQAFEEISAVQSRRAADDSSLDAGNESPALLTGKVNQLELILRQLQHDLRKEQQDKAMLQEQVQHLRQDNLRLHEESQSAAAQLRHFTEWFLSSIDKKV
ncbi:signal-induced proliferation-associated 1-like protein 2 isoform X1 [Astyanax mexicanus]|uniref:signal-induced proliferation-associated 1-like protein 2 isoform X1 n=1 Tax=Astyanax mexicanus TaxID=7994 RepID=UPI0020CB5AB2|nr:signal-induced proliferation-associated 1-like protein 2 isoform X1 [Astyanax mexicanus]